MPKLPNPQEIGRTTPTPGGPAGKLQADMIGTPKADTSIGDALMGLGEEAYRFAQKEKNRLDQVALDDAQNQLIAGTNAISEKYQAVKGQAATDKDFRKIQTEKVIGLSKQIESKLTNEEQKRAWGSYFPAFKTKFEADVATHQIRESDAWSQKTNIATIETFTNESIANYSDLKAVNEHVLKIKASVAAELVRTGNDKDPAIRDAKMNEALSPLYFGVIKNYIGAKDYPTAEALLGDKKIKSILGANHPALVQAIEKGMAVDKEEVFKLEAQNQTDIIWEKYKTAPEQLAAARKLGGSLEDAVVTRLKTRQSEFKAQKESEKLEQTLKESAIEEQAKQKKHKILVDLAQYDVPGQENFASRLEAIKNIPPDLIELKTSELKRYKKDFEDFNKGQEEKGYNEEENRLIDKITFSPGKVTPDEIRNTGQNAGNRAKLNKIYEASLKKGDAQKRMEEKLKDHYLGNKQKGIVGVFGEKLEEEAKGFEFWRGITGGGFYADFTEEEKAEVENQYYDQLDTLRAWFKENPNAKFTEAQDFFNKTVRPEIGAKVIETALKRLDKKPDVVRHAIPEGEQEKAKGQQKVKAKIMKRQDGTHYVLFPNGTKKDVTYKDGKVSF